MHALDAAPSNSRRGASDIRQDISLTSALVPTSSEGEEVCTTIERLGQKLEEHAGDNDASGQFAAKSVLMLRDANVLAACIPQERGGMGLVSLYDLTVAVSRLATYDASVATATYMHLALAWYFSRTVRCDPDLPADSTFRTWVDAIGDRRMIVCSAVAEPGSAPGAHATTAVRQANGWFITGRKSLASISPIATHFYTRLRVDTDDGPMTASVMVPADAAGVTVHDDWDGLGLRGSGSGRVTFDRVLVDPAAVRMRGRWGAWTESSGLEGKAAIAIPFLGISLGIAERARREALGSLRTKARGAGRNPLDSSATRTLTAELELRLAGARSALHVAAAEADDHITDATPGASDSELGEHLVRNAVIAGMLVERAALSAVDIAMEIIGGRSYVTGNLVGRLCRDVRAEPFMRPRAPAEEWSDYLTDQALLDGTLS